MAVSFSLLSVLLCVISTSAISNLDTCLPPSAVCSFNRDCCGGREPMSEDMTSSTRCLGICCIKVDHGQCHTDADCCLESTFCDVSDGGFCRARPLHLAAAIRADAAMLTKDDYPMRTDGDKTKFVLLILISIALINTVCFLLHRFNHKIFFVSKAQIKRITHDMDDSDSDYESEEDDGDSEVNEEYLNEPSPAGRARGGVRGRQLMQQQPPHREYDIDCMP